MSKYDYMRPPSPEERNQELLEALEDTGHPKTVQKMRELFTDAGQMAKCHEAVENVTRTMIHTGGSVEDWYVQRLSTDPKIQEVLRILIEERSND